MKKLKVPLFKQGKLDYEPTVPRMVFAHFVKRYLIKRLLKTLRE